MSVRRVLTAALLVFVAVAVAAVVLQSVNRQEAIAESEQASAETVQDGVVAYYFHGDKRCPTCRKLEAYSREAIEQGFPDGSLGWRAVNTDLPENAHFITEFELSTKSVVLVEYRGGEVKRWQNLKLIWQLVGEKDGFLKYVRDGAREFTAGA